MIQDFLKSFFFFIFSDGFFWNPVTVCSAECCVQGCFQPVIPGEELFLEIIVVQDHQQTIKHVDAIVLRLDAFSVMHKTDR